MESSPPKSRGSAAWANLMPFTADARTISKGDDGGPKRLYYSTTLPSLCEAPARDALWFLSPFVLLHSNRARMCWEFMLLFVLLYVGTIYPYRVSFVYFKVHLGDGCKEQEESEHWERFELFISVFFWIDLFMNFFLTYHTEDGVEVVVPSKIAMHYIRGFFFLNLLACLPASAFAPLNEAIAWNPSACAETSPTATRLLRLQRATRLAQMVRVIGTLNIIKPLKRWVSHTAKMQRTFRLLNRIVFLGWFVHMLACGWYLCAAMHKDPRETWLNRRDFVVIDGDGRSLIEAPASTQWTHSMYFILTVFTTVGFGDMYPVTVTEILYVVFVMMVGAIAHSIIISEMINLVSEVDEDVKWRKGQVHMVEAYSEHAGLDSLTRENLIRWIAKMPTGRNTFDPQEMRRFIITAGLPRKLLKEIPERLFHGHLLRNKFMRACAVSCPEGAMPPRFSVLLSTVLSSPQFFQAGDTVFEKHDHAFTLYFVMSGTFAFVAEAAETGSRNSSRGPDFHKGCSVLQLDTCVDRANTVETTNMDSRANTDHASHVTRYRSVDGTMFAVLNPTECYRAYSSGHRNGIINSMLDQTRGAWSCDGSKVKEWLQINLGTLRNVCGVSIQGHPRNDEWVTKLKVYVSRAGAGEWEEVRLCLDGCSARSCMDGNEKVEFMLKVPLFAQFVRIEPREWHGDRASMRAAIIVIEQKLFPYLLLGSDSYFGEDVLLSGTRKSTVRCEADGRAMRLRKQDLAGDGAGARLLEEFPQFQRVLRFECIRLSERHRRAVKKLTFGCQFETFAANAIQDSWRRHRKKRGTGGAPRSSQLSQLTCLNDPTQLVRRLSTSPTKAGLAWPSMDEQQPRALGTAGAGELEAKVDRLASEVGVLRSEFGEFRADVAAKFKILETLNGTLERLAQHLPRHPGLPGSVEA